MFPTVGQTGRVKLEEIGTGIAVRRLIGRELDAAWCTGQASLSLFELEAGAASQLGHNKIGQESFIVLSGLGSVLIDGVVQPLQEGSFVVLPPSSVRSVRADQGHPLRYFALTTPAWSIDDNVPDPEKDTTDGSLSTRST